MYCSLNLIASGAGQTSSRASKRKGDGLHVLAAALFEQCMATAIDSSESLYEPRSFCAWEQRVAYVFRG